VNAFLIRIMLNIWHFLSIVIQQFLIITFCLFTFSFLFYISNEYQVWFKTNDEKTYTQTLIRVNWIVKSRCIVYLIRTITTTTTIWFVWRRNRLNNREVNNYWKKTQKKILEREDIGYYLVSLLACICIYIYAHACSCQLDEYKIEMK
jgi:hypothetical protein